MKASDLLLSLESGHLEVWRFQNQSGRIGVSYKNAEVKEGSFLRGTFGSGKTFDEACEDYLNQIRGKTLVFNAYSDMRREVKILG